MKKAAFKFNLLMSSSFLLTVIAIPVIGMLLFSEIEFPSSFWRRGDLFWYRIAWCEILYLFLWFGGIHVPFRNMLEQRHQVGGIFPASSIAVISACVLAYLTMFVSLFLPETRLFKALFICVQIIIFIFCLWKIAFFQAVMKMQLEDTEAIPTSIKSPLEIAVMLEQCIIKNKADSKLNEKLKQLHAKFKYSLPICGKIASSRRYAEISRKMDEICCDIIHENAGKKVFSSFDDIETELLLLNQELKK